MTFAELGLRPELVRAVTDAGYTIPTPIQERAIPVALDGQDLIACAQTGTGKTAAFLLPILQHLAAGQRGRHPRALIVTPTRELAAQIGEMATVYGTHLHLRSTVIFGGVGMEPQTRRLCNGLDLLIATPGRLLDHLGRGQAHLGQVAVVVLDEADRMLDMGFLPDVRRILGKLPAKRQNLFYSATMPDEIENLIRRTTHNPTMVEVTRRATPVSTISQIVPPGRDAPQEGSARLVAPAPRHGANPRLYAHEGAGQSGGEAARTVWPPGGGHSWEQESGRAHPRARRFPCR